MSFFDKKQEVMSVELTQYGKYLLSKGKFKPYYYNFIDDDILYDSTYGGFQENNSNISNRIRNETPSCKPQYIFSGVETKLNQALELLRTGKIKLESDTIQQKPEKQNFTAAPLGNSDLSSNNMPAWKIKLLKGKINSIKQSNSGSNYNLTTPEIYTDTIQYKIKNVTNNLDEEIGNYDLVSTPFEDDSYIRIIGDSILLDIKEENATISNSNFEFELYIQEIDEETLEEKLIPLYFPEKQSSIKNNILIGDGSEDSFIDVFDDPKYAEYFLDINIDSKIPETTKEILVDSKQDTLQIITSNNNSIKSVK